MPTRSSKGEGEAQGATIYTLSETASDAEAARLAENENRADVIAGIDMSHEPGDVADILIDLAQRETKAFSLHFAKTLVADMKKVARMHKNPLKSAGFKVLKAPDVPAVLIELGYVSSKDDLKQLTSGAWQGRRPPAPSCRRSTISSAPGWPARPAGRRRPMTGKPQFEHKNPRFCGTRRALARRVTTRTMPPSCACVAGPGERRAQRWVDGTAGSRRGSGPHRRRVRQMGLPQ